jgi:RNA polymerase sigma-70 factor (ECF subfamily)
MSFLWPSPDDRLLDLIERAKRGDREAFRSLYLALYDPVACFIGRRIGSQADAEDLVSRVFWKLLDRLSDFDARRGSPRMFVLSIARNAVIDHLRTRRDAVPVDDLGGALVDETGTPLDALVREEELSEVRALVLELPEETREMLALRFGDGLKHGEIAQMLGLEVAAVKQRFSRTLKGLRERLAEKRRRREEALKRGVEGAVINVR